MGRRYVSFTLGSGCYCIPVDQVLQILRHENLLEVPKAPPFVEGVINIRGSIIPVVNLRQRLEIAPEQREKKKERIVVTQLENRSYGLAVDDVREIVEIEDAEIQPEAASLFGARAAFIRGIAQRNETLYLVLDLPRVFAAGRDAPGAAQG
jgi:purine-binding chemotaxis protein CheW